MTEEYAKMELSACEALPVEEDGLNPDVILPYSLTSEQVLKAMISFVDFLTFVNTQLNSKSIPRMEKMLMAANFSSMVGEFMVSNIPKYCPTIVKNKYHNGHPDLIPVGQYVGDSVQYAHVGIEVKSSRYEKGWQGHNPEAVFLMVFVFDSDTNSNDSDPKSFEFKAVFCAELEENDWTSSGRKEGSRRTPTASINKTGYEKMKSNWLYLNNDMKIRLDKI